MTKRWLITRPAQEATELATQLQARGHGTVLAPVIRIVPAHDVTIDLEGVQALLFTSANGVRAFAKLDGRRGVRVLAVGEITAEAAREAGFAMVEAAGGNAEALARLARDRLDPAAGALLHGAGRHLAGDLRSALQADGFEVRQVPLYEAEAVERLPTPAVEALESGTLDGVVFFSVRSADIFMRLADAAGVRPRLAGLTALCLSQDVADRLAPAGEPAAWGSVRVAVQPNRAAMLALADEPAAAAVTDTDADARTGPAREEEPMVPADDPERSDPEEQPADNQGDGEAEAATAQVIQMFGGIRPMAGKLGAPVTTVQGWKRRGHIPETRHRDIAEAAERHHIDLPSRLLAATRPPDGGEHPEGAEAADAAGEAAAPQTPPTAPADEAATAAPAAASARPPSTQAPAAAAAAMPATAPDDDQTAQHGAETPEEADYPMHPEPARGGSGLAWLALLIALAAAAAATAPWWAGEQLASLTGTPTAATLADQVTTLEATVEAGPDLAPLESRIAALEQGVGSAAPAAALTQVEQRLSTVEGEASRAGASAEQLQALVTRLDAIEEAAPEGSAPAVAASLTQLERRVAAVEQAVAGGAQDEALSAVVERLNGLETEVGSLQSSDALTALSQQVTAASQELAAVAQRLSALEQVSVRIDGAEGQLTALDQRLDALEALGLVPGAAIEGRLSALEAVEPVDEAAIAARHAALAETVDQVRAQVGRIAAQADRLDSAIGDVGGMVGGLPAIETRMQALETAQTANAMLRQSLVDLSERVQQLSADVRTTDQRLDQEVTGATAGLAQEIASIRSQVDTSLASVQGRVDRVTSQVTTDLASMDAAIDQLIAADTTTQAVLLAVGQLQNAIERGQEYTTALATAQSVAADDPELAPELAILAEHAAVGIPSRRQLEAQFQPMAEAVRRADTLPPDADWLDQTGAALRGLVSVRPVAGEIAGDDVPAIMARAEGRMNIGDLAGAVQAMQALSGPPAAAAAEWVAAATARLAAEGALQALTDRAVSRLTGVEPMLAPASDDVTEPTEAPAEAGEAASDSASAVDESAGDAAAEGTVEAEEDTSSAAPEGAAPSDEAASTSEPPAAEGEQPEAAAEGAEGGEAPAAAEPQADEPPAVDGDAAAPAAEEPQADEPAAAGADAEAPAAEGPQADQPAAAEPAADSEPASEPAAAEEPPPVDVEQPAEPVTGEAGDPS